MGRTSRVFRENKRVMRKFIINEKDENINFPICINCKHHLQSNKCKAFDEIPKSILIGIDKHKKPYNSQKNRLTFEPNDNA